MFIVYKRTESALEDNNFIGFNLIGKKKQNSASQYGVTVLLFLSISFTVISVVSCNYKYFLIGFK